MHKQGLFGLALLSALALGCGNSSTAKDMAAADLAMKPADLSTQPADMSMGPDLAPATVNVQVGAAGNTFSPKTVTVNVGDTVKWTWVGNNHNVVSASSATNASLGVSDGRFCDENNQNCANAPLDTAGHTYSFTFTTKGTYDYFCKPHAAAGMTGTITVQ
jgi:plastocyanin